VSDGPEVALNWPFPDLNFFYSAQCLMVRRWRLIGHFPFLYNPHPVQDLLDANPTNSENGCEMSSRQRLALLTLTPPFPYPIRPFPFPILTLTPRLWHHTQGAVLADDAIGLFPVRRVRVPKSGPASLRLPHHLLLRHARQENLPGDGVRLG
jgi:hypothetical protein